MCLSRRKSLQYFNILILLIQSINIFDLLILNTFCKLHFIQVCGQTTKTNPALELLYVVTTLFVLCGYNRQNHITLLYSEIMGMKKKSPSIFSLPKEYSENATVHGVAYIFSAENAIEKFIW